MSTICEHGSLKRSCEICQRDEEIASLRLTIQNYRDALTKKIDAIGTYDTTQPYRMMVTHNIDERARLTGRLDQLVAGWRAGCNEEESPANVVALAFNDLLAIDAKVNSVMPPGAE